MFKKDATEDQSVWSATSTALTFAEKLPAYLTRSQRTKKSFCVRPQASHLIQLDDLNSADAKRFSDLAFLTIETSPENFQVWLALDTDCADRRGEIRRRLLDALLPGAVDRNASGALRFPESGNYKLKYAARGFPQVKVVSARLHKTVTECELIAAGILFFPPIHLQTDVRDSPVPDRCSARPPREFPSWEIEYRQGPAKNAGGGIDESRVDFRWSLRSLRCGWSEANVIAELPRVSKKAHAKGYAYIARTVRAAAGYYNRGLFSKR